MLESALRRMDEGQPPLLGLRWVPSEVKLLRASPRPEADRPARVESTEELHEVCRLKDRQIRQLRELAIDVASDLPARPQIRHARVLKAITQWRVHTIRAQQAKLIIAFDESEAQRNELHAWCEQLDNERQIERAALIFELERESSAVERMLCQRADIWRVGRAAGTWRRRALGSPTELAIARGAERLYLRRGLFALGAHVVRQQQRGGVHARAQANLRRRQLQSAARRLRPAEPARRSASGIAQRDQWPSPGGRLRARLLRGREQSARLLGLRRALLELSRRQTEGRAAKLRLAASFHALASAAERRRAEGPARWVRAWRAEATERLRGFEAVLGAAGIEQAVAAIECLAHGPPAKGSARASGTGGQRDALVLCAGAIDGLRTQLARSEARLAATRELGALAVQRRVREATLAELELQTLVANGQRALAHRQALQAHEAARSARARARQEQLERMRIWRHTHGVDLFEGGLILMLSQRASMHGGGGPAEQSSRQVPFTGHDRHIVAHEENPFV